MANPHTLQAALDSLYDRGVRTVAVVRLFVSGRSFLHQTEYLFGLRSDAPARAMVGHRMVDGAEMPPLDLKGDLLLDLEGLSGSAEVTGILADRARATADDPSDTGILLIRGIGGARVLVLLDGRPAPGALLENRDLSRVSLAGVERVEVVKGPLSSLYGSDALGGVVNLITRAPAEGLRVDAQAASGTAGRRGAEATASGGGARLRYRVTGSWRQEDRVAGTDVASANPLARVRDLKSRIDVDAGDRWDVRAEFSWQRERQRWPVGGDFSGFNDNVGYSGWLEGRRRTGRGALAKHDRAEASDGSGTRGALRELEPVTPHTSDRGA